MFRCRTCLATNVRTKLITESGQGAILLLLIPENVLNYTTECRICYKCEWMLKRIEKFRVQCYNADGVLRQVLARPDFISYINFKLERWGSGEPVEPSATSILSIDVTNRDDSKLYAVFSHSRQPIMPAEVPMNNQTNTAGPDSDSSTISNTEDISIEMVKIEYDSQPNDDASIKDDNIKSESGNIFCNKGQHLNNDLGPSMSTNIIFTIPRDKISKKKQINDDPTNLVVDEMVADIAVLSIEEQKHYHQLQKYNRNYLSRKFKCENCFVSFKFEHKFEKHMKSHSEDQGSHICHICTKRFYSSYRLNTHLLSHKFRYSCKQCNFHNHNRYLMIEHLGSHVGKYNSCPLCNAVFLRKSNLRNHIKLRHNDTEYKCERCEKTFLSEDGLRKHSNLSESSLVCKICGKQCCTLIYLNIHTKTHTKMTDYCAKCDIHFKNSDTYYCHMKYSAKHIDPTSLQFTCSECDKRFRTASCLEQHTNAAHLNLKNFDCSICNKSYASKRGRDFHKRLAHEGFKLELKHKCSFCEKLFTSKYQLTKHLTTHTGEKPYECDECQRRFSQKSSLRTHIKLIHLKQKMVYKKKLQNCDCCSSINIDKTRNLELEYENNSDHKYFHENIDRIRSVVEQSSLTSVEDDALDNYNGKNEAIYTQKIRKVNRNSGKKYLTKLGKIVPEKKFENKDCQCARACINLISEAERKQHFDKFWNLGDFNKQNIFLHGCIRNCAIKRRRPRNCKGTPKTSSYRYYLSQASGDIIVCKKFFINTFDISKGRLDRVLKAQIVGKDLRGRKQGSSRKIKENEINIVKEPNQSFPKFEYHNTINHNPEINI